MPAQKTRVSEIIRERKIAKVQRENSQRKLISDDDIFHSSIVEKLRGRMTSFDETAQQFLPSPQFLNLERCGHERIFRTCRECSSVEQFEYRCNLKWCPRCQWRIAEQRRLKISEWSAHVTQPKHVVTTQKNFPVLTRTRIKELQQNLVALRRSTVFAQVRGGCVSIEITNEGNGWHLHAHWLLDVRWLDAHALSLRWGELVGQTFAIVKVQDVRDRSYVAEVCKYLAKGSEIASWPAEQLLEFVTAIRGRRFFFSFGTLFHAGAEIRAALRRKQHKETTCECGCSKFRFETEQAALLREIRKNK